MKLTTVSGRVVDVLNPDLGTIAIEDVAYQLDATPRWGGACRPWYSVAMHSLAVMEDVARVDDDPLCLLWALLHDAAEAYLGDLPRPLKQGCQIEGLPFDRVEYELRAAIVESVLGERTEPTPGQWCLIHAADDRRLVTEARDLLPRGAPWEGRPSGVEPDTRRVFLDGGAELRFLEAVQRLVSQYHRA